MKRLALAAIAACGGTPHPVTPNAYVITASRIYTAPDQPPLDHAWVEVQGDQILAVGTGQAPDVRHDDTCSGGVITAGFQNNHVHFVAPAFVDAAKKSPAELEGPVADLTTKWGFTTVSDTSSFPGDTIPLRDRITRGELRGPTIHTVGLGIYADIPFYLNDLPDEVKQKLPRPKTPDDAKAVVQANFAVGADSTKLFIATPMGKGEIHRLAPDVAKAAVEESHHAGKMVMVHPTDPQGVQDAVDAGVDIIVHTTIDPDPSVWSPELIHTMIAKHISVVPTLKLWSYELAKHDVPKPAVEKIVNYALVQLHDFVQAGGQVLFGTDTGYMTDHDPTDEYVLMAKAGMTPLQILASLTTNPAAKWNESDKRGRVVAKLAADLVVLDGDPATDVKKFAAVKCAIRAGKIQWDSRMSRDTH
ncbi:MAG: amidohydrolase family protein [Kofleriaceae bacterium]